MSQCQDCMKQNLGHVFRSATAEEMPLLDERISCMREAGQILLDVRGLNPLRSQADGD